MSRSMWWNNSRAMKRKKIRNRVKMLVTVTMILMLKSQTMGREMANSLLKLVKRRQRTTLLRSLMMKIL